MSTLTESDLNQFTGTETWFRHSLVWNVTFTEGVQFLAEKAGAYWLVDEVATNQLNPKIKKEEFQAWKLKLDSKGHGATLTVDDGNGNIVFSKKIEYTDFPLPEITLWFSNNVIMLPSEY